MPAKKRRNKDLKRLVRSRMQKTGESYTTARAHLIARRSTAAPPIAKTNATTNTNGAVRAAEPADLAQLAGMRDETIAAKTGCTWASWVRTLDKLGAASMTHPEIAALVHERFKVSGWWSQTVTVGYERIRGRRSRNQVARGDFTVSKSRTFAVPVATLVQAFAPKARAQWLGAEVAKERKTTTKVVRWIEADGTWADVFLLPKGTSKSTANAQLSRLSSSEHLESWRARWAERLQALAEWLARRG